MIWIFWVSVAALFYSVAGYGLAVLIVSQFFPRRLAAPPGAPLLFSFLIPAHNESAVIADKLRNTLALQRGPHAIEVVVVSDGSTDRTAEIARSFADPRILVLETAGRAGKADAMNLGLARCSGDAIVFSDANSLLAEGSLLALARHFGDASVGGVCGRISVSAQRRGPIGAAESLFWTYDQAIKQAESRVGGAVSAQGSIYAIRRDLTAPLVLGCADDFLMSVRAVAQGRRLVFEPDAVSGEVVTEKLGREMGRRIRSTERGWRGLMLCRRLLNPMRHGWYAWQLFSHKLVRRLNPVLLMTLFASNLFLLGDGWFYRLSAVAQVLFYLLGGAAIAFPAVRRFKPAGLAGFLVFTHAAMFLGIARYYLGHRSLTWTPVREAE